MSAAHHFSSRMTQHFNTLARPLQLSWPQNHHQIYVSAVLLADTAPLLPSVLKTRKISFLGSPFFAPSATLAARSLFQATIDPSCQFLPQPSNPLPAFSILGVRHVPAAFASAAWKEFREEAPCSWKSHVTSALSATKQPRGAVNQQP